MTATDHETTGPAVWEHRLEAGGVPVVVRRAGSGTSFLFLHGYTHTGRWLPFHAALAAAGDVVAPDLPGFGGSPAAPEVTGFDDLVLLLRDVLDALELERVHVVGHSLGGWAAAALAVHHPHRVRSLTLFAPFGLRVPGAPITDFFAAAPDVRQLLPFSGDARRHPDLLVDARSPEGYAQLYAEATAAGRYMWNPRYDVKFDARLPRLRVPTLLVAGEADRVVPRAHVDRWAELLPDARVEVVAGAGNALLVQQPEHCAALVTAHATTGARR